MTTDHQVLCIEHIDEDGVATMTNHMGRFVHYSHTSVLVRKAPAPLPMGTKVFDATQTAEDLERLRVVYEAAPLLPGKPS